MERKLTGKLFRKLGPRQVVLSLENVIPFANGSCLKFKADVLVEWKVPYAEKILVGCKEKHCDLHNKERKQGELQLSKQGQLQFRFHL